MTNASVITGANSSVTRNVRTHLLTALSAVVESTRCYPGRETNARLGELLLDLDDHLTRALLCLNRLGLTNRRGFEESLAAAQGCLNQLLGLVEGGKGASLRMLLNHANNFVKAVYTNMPHLADAPDVQVACPPRPVSRPTRQPNIPFQGLLSDRERQVVKLFAQGKHSREIAQRLKVTDSTVRAHAEHVRKKLRASTMNQVVAMYVAAESEDYGEEEE